MKILVVTQYFYPENFRVNTLCTKLVEKGHAVTVLTGYPQYPQGKLYDGYSFRKPYEKNWNGVKIERIKVYPRGKTPIGMFLNCWSFVSEGRKWVHRCKEHFDAVYVFEVSPVTVGLPAVAYKQKFNTPLLFNVQDLWPENVEVVLGIKNKVIIGCINKIVDKIYMNSDIILCSSNGFVENIVNRGVPRKKLVFWPQFCVEPNFDDLSKPSIYEDTFFNIVFAGNIGDAQGLDLLIDAAYKMKDTKVRWFLVGDGRAKERLQKKVSDYQLDNNVIFVGKMPEQEANRYIHYANCAYLSFKNNRLFDMTIPAKLQSYLACGTPVLAAAGGESARIIEEARCGVACTQQIESVVNAVYQIMQLGEKNNFSTNAYQCFKKNYEVDYLVSIFCDILDECVKKYRS